MRSSWLVMAGALLEGSGCGRWGFDDAPARGVDAATLVPDGPWPTVPDGCDGPDEDGDAWPNACDNCPTEPNPDQADVGERDAGAAPDGLGDACDPRPAEPGDYIARFHTHDAMPPVTHAYDWSYPGNGAVRMGETTGTGQYYFPLPLGVTRADSRYTVRRMVDAESYFGVWLSQSAGGAVFGSVVEQQADGAPPFFQIKDQAAAGTAWSTPAHIAPLEAGQRVRIVLDTTLATGGEWRLRGTQDAALGVTALPIQTPDGGAGYLDVYGIALDVEDGLSYAR